MRISQGVMLVLIGSLIAVGCQKKAKEAAEPSEVEILSADSSVDVLSNEAVGALTSAATLSAAGSMEPLTNAQATLPTAPLVAVASGPLGSAAEIQAALKASGFYKGTVDGKIGPMTRESIKAFQQAHGLQADGKVGPKTWAALKPYLQPRAQQPVSE